MYRRETAPYNYAFVQRNLGNLWFWRERWTEAFVSYSEALEVDESLLGSAESLTGRQDFLRENRVALPRAAYCLARLGRLAEAATVLEGGRTRTLNEILGKNRLSRATSAISRAKNLRSLVDQLQCPLIYLAATSAGCFAIFVLPPGKSRESCDVLWLGSFDLEQLHDQIFGLNYNSAVLAGDDQTVRSILDQTWASWRNDLAAPLAVRVGELGYRRAVLIPMGLLGVLPLASAAVGQTTFAVAPSARILRSAVAGASSGIDVPPVLCGVADPASGAPALTFSVMELREIATLFPETGRRLLVGNQARRAALQSGLPGATYVHLACHGQFKSRDIPGSFFRLAGRECIEVRDFWQGTLNLSHCRLAVLSACSSGVMEIRDQPEEALGLPAALLQAGVPAVLSSLWPVADASTALLLIRFYREHLVAGRPPAEALAAAQLWLQSATSAELGLENLYGEIYRHGPDSETRAYAFRQLRLHRNKPDQCPFEHPFYWAGFFLTGVGFDISSAGVTRARGSAKTV